MSKIGLVIPYWSDINKSELIEMARLAEELGFHSLWISEMWGRDSFSLLAFLAVHTKKINLGTGIVSVFSRTPATIAQTIATLDEISEGRMILGLGTSGPAGPISLSEFFRDAASLHQFYTCWPSLGP